MEGTAHSRLVTHSNPVAGVRFLARGALGPAQPEGGRLGAKEGAAEARKPFSLLEAWASSGGGGLPGHSPAPLPGLSDAGRRAPGDTPTCLPALAGPGTGSQDVLVTVGIPAAGAWAESVSDSLPWGDWDAGSRERAQWRAADRRERGLGARPLTQEGPPGMCGKCHLRCPRAPFPAPDG